MKIKLIYRYLYANKGLPVLDIQHHPVQLARERIEEGGAAIQVSVEGLSTESTKDPQLSTSTWPLEDRLFSFYGMIVEVPTTMIDLKTSISNFPKEQLFMETLYGKKIES